MQEKEVSKVRWKGHIVTGQDCQEVVLECVNGALCPIAAMHAWRDELEGDIPLEGDCLFVSKAGFIIQDLDINREPTGRQMRHNSVVGCNAVAITLGLEGLLEDEVAVAIGCGRQS